MKSSYVRRALLLIFLVSASGCYDRSRPTHIGQAAKDFSLQDSDRRVTLNQFRGQVVILNFWASWCEPCVEELPSLMNLQQRTRAEMASSCSASALTWMTPPTIVS